MQRAEPEDAYRLTARNRVAAGCTKDLQRFARRSRSKAERRLRATDVLPVAMKIYSGSRGVRGEPGRRGETQQTQTFAPTTNSIPLG